MTSAAELQVRFTATGAQQVQGEIAKTGNAVKGFGGIVSGVGKAAVAGMIGIGAAAGVGLGLAAKSALGFEQQMANVNSIMQLSDAGIKSYSDQVLQLAQNPGITQSPQELAAGLYNIASSGFQGADGLLVLNAAATSATAGMTTTDVAAQGITAALNAYGLEASNAGNISDIMFQTVNDGVITFDQLASNMGNVLPVANSLGVGMDQVGAAYAQMTLNGVSASQAETQISSLMRSALNPTEALTSAVQAHGYASAESLIQTEGLSGFLKVLDDASGGSKEALLALTGTQEGMNAATILGKDGVKAYDDELDKMKHASDGAGATQKALEKQMKSASFQIAKAKQSVQILAVTLGGLLTPAIGAAARGLTSFINKGLLPFGKMIGAAFKGTDGWQKMVDKLPAPLQRAGHALGSLADSVGDVVTAFGERGLAGAIQTLTTGGELDQMGAAFSALADEAWSAIQAGFNAIPWGTLWDIAVMGITAAAGGVIDILDWTINVGAPDLIGWIANEGTDLWGWIKKRMGLAGGTVGDGTGGPETDRQPISITDWAIDVAEPSITGWISNLAGGLYGWLHDKIFGVGAPDGTGGPEPGGSGSFRYTIGGVVFDILEPLIDLKAGDIHGWIQEQIGTLGTIAADINNWSIALTGEPAISFGESGSGTGGGGSGAGGLGAGSTWNIPQRVQEKLQSIADSMNGDKGLAIDSANWIIKVTNSPQPEIQDTDDFNDRLTLMMQDYMDGTVFKAVMNHMEISVGAVTFKGKETIRNAWDTFKSDLGEIFDFSGIFDGGSGAATGLFNDAGEQVFGSGGITAAIGGWVSGIVGDITAGLSIWQGEIADAVKGIIPDSIDFDVPSWDFVGGVETWALDQFSSLLGWITSNTPDWLKKLAAGDIMGVINSIFGGGGGDQFKPPAGVSSGSDFKKQFPDFPEAAPTASNQPGNINGVPVTTLPNTGTGPGMTPMKIPAPDLSAFTAGMNQMPVIAGQASSGALSAATTYISAMGSVVGGLIGSMVGNVSALMGQNTNNIGQAMSTALGVATVYASAIYSNVSTQIGMMVGNVSALVNTIPGIIAGALSSAADTAFSYGANIGASLAAGISSQVGAVAAAAQQLADAASSAVAARAKIASPSKVFMELGGYIGEGFSLGIKQTFPDVNRTGRALVAASIAAQNQRYASSGTAYGESTGRNGISGSGPVTYNTGPKYYGAVTLMPQSPEVHQAISSSAIRRGRP